MKTKRILAFLLSMAMTVSILSSLAITALAEETQTTATEKNITLGTTALKGGQASNVYFGNYQQSSLGATKPTTGTEGVDWIESTTAVYKSKGPYYSKDPIKWRVLSNADGKAFLLSDKNLDVVSYHKNSENVTWEKSTIRSWLNGYGAEQNQNSVDYSSDNFINVAFCATEKSVIAETTVVNATYDGTSGANPNPSYSTSGGNDTTDKVFLLSIAEAQNTAYGFTGDTSSTDTRRKAVNTAYVYGGGKNGESDMRTTAWLLRSPGGVSKRAAEVDEYGIVGVYGSKVTFEGIAVRPAFNLNLSSVLFTSAAKNGKPEVFGKVSEYTGNEYKLTLKDSSRSSFTASVSDVLENKLIISYTNATAGTNEYISAIIESADGNVTHYGRLANVTGESGTASLDMTGITLASTDRLYIFNEQINGDYKTDYSSELKEMTTEIILTKDKISAWIADTENATLIVASYADKALKDVKTIPVTSNMYEKTLTEIGLVTEGADTVKAFLWTGITTLTPLCEAKEVALGE